MIERHADAHGVIARVHVKYDSGMGRLGEADPEVKVRAAFGLACGTMAWLQKRLIFQL